VLAGHLANKNSAGEQADHADYCRTSLTTAYFLLAEDFKDDLWFFNV